MGKSGAMNVVYFLALYPHHYKFSSLCEPLIRFTVKISIIRFLATYQKSNLWGTLHINSIQDLKIQV